MWFLFGLFLGWAVLANGRLVWPLLPASFTFAPEQWAKLKLLLLLIATLLSVWITLAVDQGTTPQGVLVLRSFFLTTRFELFVIGFLLGALININQSALRRTLRDLFLRQGDANHQPDEAGGAAATTEDSRWSWGFQGAVALIIVVLVLVIVRPEIFSYVRSFKFAGVEATFSERSAAVIKEADLHVEDLRESLTLEEYKNFYRDYIYPESPRGLARTLFGPKNLLDHSTPIAELLMIGCFRPVVASIACLNETHELGSVAQNAQLASFVYGLEHTLFNIHGTGTLSETPKLAVPEENDLAKKKIQNDRRELIKRVLTRLRDSGLAVAQQVAKVAASCVEKDEAPWKGKPPLKEPLLKYNVPLKLFLDNHSAPKDDEIGQDVEFIDEHYEQAFGILKDKGNDKPPIIALMVTDAYLIGATADLIALISGQQKDKAIFLTNMLDQFPHSDEFVTPGIINVFYQLSDARVRTLGSWSLQQILTDLNYSLHGSDVLLSRSAEWLNARRELQPPDERCLQNPDKHVERDTDKLSGRKLSQEEIERNAEIRRVWCIHDTYLRNTIISLTTKLQLFNAMELSNRPISGTFREEWRNSLGRMITLLRTRLGAAIVVPSSVPPAPLDARKAALLPTLGNTPHDMLVDADLAATLSLVLISGRENPPDTLACNLSLFLLNDADSNARLTNEGQPKDAARETRWRQLVAVHAQQIGRSCGWSESDRGTGRPMRASASTE